MARSDFTMVTFNHSFNAASPSETRNFSVEGNPVRDGYLLVQAFDVERNSHEIAINGQRLPGFDLPRDGNNEWQTWMEQIPHGFLNSGQNRITIRRRGNDDFRVANVVIHWRETS